ncbi:MAG: AbrB family transcriptional regulator [Rhodospirillaceae bacterium]|nr:AbrB family transcriptional regulator [Rhodospirillales bacterium]
MTRFPRARARAVALALALGSGGGIAFYLLDLPLPWMLGAMTACTVAALSGARLMVPFGLRSVMIAVLGIMLGSAFTPALWGQVPQWSGSLTALFAAMAATTVLVMTYLRRVAGLGMVTAYFSAAPGGLNEMVMTGGAMGGDERAIAMIHALRVLLIVFAVPLGFRLITGVHGASMTSAMGSLLALPLRDAAMLAACGVIGALVGRLLRFPAAGLTGPMAASAALHLAGVTASHPPAELVILAQVITGAGLGARFSGLRWGDVAGIAKVALGSTAIMVVISAGGALGLSLLTGQPFPLLLLAFVPGGIAEMCLIALSLGQDVAFVSTHHVLRVVMVIVAAPLVFRVMARVMQCRAG